MMEGGNNGGEPDTGRGVKVPCRRLAGQGQRLQSSCGGGGGNDDRKAFIHSLLRSWMKEVYSLLEFPEKLKLRMYRLLST